MPLFESETLRGYQYHQQNQTKLRNYYYWNQKILKNVIAPYLEKETTKNCISWVTVPIYQIWPFRKAVSDMFRNSVFQNRTANLTICPLPVFSTQNLRQKKNHSSALNENTYLFHQHFSKTKLHIIIYFWIILFHNHLEKLQQMKKTKKIDVNYAISVFLMLAPV